MPLIGAIIEMRREGAANKAAQNAESAAQLFLKGSVLLFNTGAYLNALASYTKQQAAETEALIDQLRQESDRMNDVATILVRDINENRWHLYADPKRFQKINELALMSACGWRQSSINQTLRWERLPTATLGAMPDSIKDALSTLKANEQSLDKDCTSREAVKLLKKQAAKQWRSKRLRIVPCLPTWKSVQLDGLGRAAGQRFVGRKHSHQTTIPTAFGLVAGGSEGFVGLFPVASVFPWRTNPPLSYPSLLPAARQNKPGQDAVAPLRAPFSESAGVNPAVVATS